jgi:chromosome segregation ATPase
MKNLHQNLLIVFALGLCGLCAFQWYGQTVQRTHIESLNQTLYEKAAAIQGLTNSMASLNAQITQMDARISELRQTVRTSEEASLTQKREITKLHYENSSLTNEMVEYKAALEKIETKLKEAYDGIKKQNDAVKELVAQRDEYVEKYNDSVKERNEIVNKYNDLVKQVEKLQSATAKPSGK